MEPFGAFRLLTEPHAVTLVCSIPDRHIIYLYLYMHERKTLIDTGVCVQHCNYIA